MVARLNRIRTLLYGDQRVSNSELDIISTPIVQRLYDLHQLGLTDRVFIDASHSRLHHVIGVMEQVEKLTRAIVRNLKVNGDGFRWKAGSGTYSNLDLAQMVNDRKPVARLIGLLHDLTHAPFGHTVEDEIELMACKHDDPERQADAFYRLLCQYIGWLAKDAGVKEAPAGVSSNAADGFLLMPQELFVFLHYPEGPPPINAHKVAEFALRLLTTDDPSVTRASWRLTPVEIVSFLSELHVAMTGLLHMELLHKNEPERKHFPRKDLYDFQRLIEEILRAFRDFDHQKFFAEIKFDPKRDAYLLDIVGNTVCADLLDYAHRDSHFTNIKLDYDEARIADNFTIVSWDANQYPGDNGKDQRKWFEDDPFTGHCLRTAVSLFSHKFRIDAPGELMNLLNVRFYIYERVLFHPTKCAAGAMLGTALQLLGWRPLREREEDGDLLPAYLRQVGDQVFLQDVREAGRIMVSRLEVTADETIGHDMGKAPAEFRGCAQVALSSDLLTRRVGGKVSESLLEIRAAIELFDRLRARRYFRPVFRALPNAHYKAADADARELANIFRNAQRRFEVERRIEAQAGLPIGTIVIHCPPPRPAQKIANVLLSLPHKGNSPTIRKLRHISEIEAEVFQNHHRAIVAVEDMYASMWRFVVYISPEHLDKHEHVAMVAGDVIGKVVKLHKREETEDSDGWPNDPHLQTEIKRRLAGVYNDESEDEINDPANPKGQMLVEAVSTWALEQGLDLEALMNNQIVTSDDIARALTQAAPRTTVVRRKNQRQMVLDLAKKSFGGKVPAELRPKIDDFYSDRLAVLNKEQQNVFVNELQNYVLSGPDLSDSGFFRNTLTVAEFINTLDKILSSIRAEG
jgi:HD superfamily phosphohydrolase